CLRTQEAPAMFAESLLESGIVRRQGRGWATALSITIQSLLVAAVVALPIFRPDALPTAVKSLTSPVAFGRPDLPRTEVPAPTRSTPLRQSELVFVPAERTHNHRINPTDDNDTGPPRPFVPGGPMGRPDGDPSLLGTLIPKNPPPVSGRPAERPVVSQIALGTLISRTQPVYPPLAVRTGTEGTVLLRAVIDRQGRITQVQVLSGHPLLQPAVRNAVEQWRYRPYILNGHPVEVETQITVNFKLAR
ncbi:MAG: energy transducer TonB, partial [Terriglobales bacterium]